MQKNPCRKTVSKAKKKEEEKRTHNIVFHNKHSNGFTRNNVFFPPIQTHPTSGPGVLFQFVITISTTYTPEIIQIICKMAITQHARIQTHSGV